MTVNPNWNVLQSIIKSKNSFNPYKKYTDLESETFKQRIRTQENSESSSKEPNIVFVILESWSADNIRRLTKIFQKIRKGWTSFYRFLFKRLDIRPRNIIFSSFPVFPTLQLLMK